MDMTDEAGSANEVAKLIEESRRLERVGEVAAAIRLAKQAFQLAESRQDSENQAAANVALAYAYMRLGMYPETRALCKKVLELSTIDSPARVDALLHLGTCAAETDDMAGAEDYYRQAIDLSRQIGYDRALIRGLHDLSAGVYMPRGQFALSLAADEEALKIATRCCTPELAWGPLTTMSYDYWLMGQRAQSEASLKTLQEAASAGSVGEGYWLALHGHLALEAGEYSEAEDFFKRTRSNAEASGVVEVHFIARQGFSRLNRLQHNAPAALAWATDAYTIVNRIGYRHLQGVALVERGRAARDLGDFQAAEADFDAAHELMAPLQLNFDLARLAILRASLLHQQKRIEARDAWREAILRITQGGFEFLIDQERTLALPLMATYLNDTERSLSSATAGLLEGLQRQPPAPLKIVTLGKFQTWAGTRAVDKSGLRQRKAGEVLMLLVLAPARSLAAEQVIESLWPDREPEAALSFLHQATSGLRRALEPELPEKFPSRYVAVEEGQINLTVPPGSHIDFEEFEAACKRQEWEAALSLYHGDFLPNFLYADWTVLTRQRMTYLYQQALLCQAEIWLERGENQRALAACEHVLALESWQEKATLLGMKACLAGGDRAGARRIYRRLEKSLKDELDIPPQVELQKLYRSI
jgi:DNA-binding SARP family transcriptional activator/Tfp pilus assembly protein PilF